MKESIYEPRFFIENGQHGWVVMSYSLDFENTSKSKSEIVFSLLNYLEKFFSSKVYNIHHSYLIENTPLNMKKFQLKLKSLGFNIGDIVYKTHPIVEKYTYFFGVNEISSIRRSCFSALINPRSNLFIFTNLPHKKILELCVGLIKNSSTEFELHTNEVFRLGMFFPEDNGFSQTFTLCGPANEVEAAMERINKIIQGRIGSFRTTYP